MFKVDYKDVFYKNQSFDLHCKMENIVSKKILCEIGETELDILKDEKTSQTITLDSREHNHVKFKQNLEKQCAKKRNKFNQHAVKVLNAEKSNKKTFPDHSTLLVKLDLEKKDTFGHLKKNNTPDHLEKTIFHFWLFYQSHFTP